ncbi:MAG: hypothetical protein Q8P22_00305 [Chloroflexota bacterium]|nr:hypothetical protein [Chloroflexota bacterium]
MVKFELMFMAPCTMPNGLQGTKEGLWMVDQLTDDVFLVDAKGKTLRHLKTESENGSGIAFGDGALWISNNSIEKPRREPRPTDRGGKWIIKVDPKTGKTLEAHNCEKLGGVEGGIHGVEWANGMLWVGRPGAKLIQQINPKDFSCVGQIVSPLPLNHGLAWENGSLWCAYRKDCVIIRHDPKTSRELERIEVPKDGPEPHGLTLWNGDLIFCDATSPKKGQVVRIIRK